MYKTIYAALVGAALVSVPLAAFAQQVQPIPAGLFGTDNGAGAGQPPVSAPTNPYAYSETAPDTWRNFPGYAAPVSAANPTLRGASPFVRALMRAAAAGLCPAAADRRGGTTPPSAPASGEASRGRQEIRHRINTSLVTLQVGDD